VLCCCRYTSSQLVEVNAHSLFSKWFSESGKLVSKLFAAITELVEEPQALVFVLIDEVESLTAARKVGTAATCTWWGDGSRCWPCMGAWPAHSCQLQPCHAPNVTWAVTLPWPVNTLLLSSCLCRFAGIVEGVAAQTEVAVYLVLGGAGPTKQLPASGHD